MGAGVSAWGNSWLKAWGNSWGPVWRPTGGWDDSHVDLVKLREGIKRAQEERDRLEAERIAEAQSEAAEVLARIARAKEPEQAEPVVIPIPEAVEPEPFTKVEPLAPVNDLVATFVEPGSTLEQPVATFEELAIQNQDDTIALLLILAEID